MKVKIKGLVFVGFAAAILSANAMAANEANTVTSKAYTEATYHKKANDNYQVSKSDGTWQYLGTTLDPNDDNYVPNNGVTAATIVNELDQLTAGLAVNENLQAEKYVEIEDITDPEGHVTGHKIVLDDDEITSTGTTLDTASDNLVTENVIAAAVNAKLDHNQGSANSGKILVINSQGEVVPSADTGANTYQAKTTATQKKVVGDPNGAWSTIDSAVKESASGYIDISADTTANDGSILVNIDPTKIVGTKAAVTSGTTELTTATGVKEYAQKISETANQISDGNGGWKSLNSTVTVTNGTATEGSNGATTQAIVDYVQSQTHGNVIPEQNTAVCTAAHPCALVNEAGNLNWRTMATADHDGGACGNAGGTCPTTVPGSGSGTSGQ